MYALCATGSRLADHDLEPETQRRKPQTLNPKPETPVFLERIREERVSTKTKQQKPKARNPKSQILNHPQNLPNPPKPLKTPKTLKAVRQAPRRKPRPVPRLLFGVVKRGLGV